MITPYQKDKIQRVVSVFETSSTEARYDTIAILKDGPSKGYQVTYGKHQAAESGGLKGLLKLYCESYGRYSRELRPYLPMIGDPTAALHKNYRFRELLKVASTDSVMQEVQDKFFDQHYWDPALAFFQRNGFILPLSMLVIYDSYIQSGGILDFLRKRFAERPPVHGGQEKEWIEEYTRERDQWLENHSNPVLPETDYRTDCLLEAIAAGNWELRGPLVCKFNSKEPHRWVTIK